MKMTTDKRIVSSGQGLRIPTDLLDDDADCIRTKLRWVNAILGRGSMPDPSDLGLVDRQRLYVIKVQMEPLLCPACHSGEPPILAADDFVQALSDTGTHDSSYTCRRCGEGLTYTVPLVGNHRWHLTAALERRRGREASDA